MNKIIRVFAFLALPGLIVVSACHKDNTTPTTPAPQQTALQTYISNDTSLSIYNAALSKANDNSLVAGNDSVTLLIPTNNAFRQAGITASSISNMSSAAVDSLLRYHIVNGTVNLEQGKYNPITTSLGTKLYGFGGSVDSNYFNGVQASLVPVSGTKGTVYRLNAPLAVPFGTSADFFNADTSFTFLQSALTRAGIDVSTDTGFTTVLAPNNNAFRNAGYATLADITGADSAKLRRILSYNILPGQFFSNSYNGMTTVGTSLNGANITIGTGPNGATFTGSGNTTAATFSGPNQLVGQNAVYEPINGVLMPSP